MNASPAPAWHPLLAGAEGEAAAAALAELIPAVRAASGSLADATLAGGQAGLAVLFAYLAEARPGEGLGELAEGALDRAADLIANRPLPPGLYEGYSGVGWAMQHLACRLFAPADEGEDPNQEIDEAVLAKLAGRGAREPDLLGGLVGFGVYALERLPRKSAVECLERVVVRLGELAEPEPGGISWRMTRERQALRGGTHDLGVAHGVPGVIALLADACAAGVARPEARRLLDGAVAWLRRQRLPEGQAARYPCVAQGTTPARAAWCYGDPGIAAVLWRAARAVGESAWEAEALDLARLAGRRPPEETGVVDAGLCHGAAGLGHLFGRLHHATGDPLLGEAARSWFARALALRRPGRGVGGWAAAAVHPGGEVTWTDDPGFLEGAAGIALALLSATEPVEPAWDRVLLLSGVGHGG